MFWFNPSETFIDISEGGSAGATYKESHWMSESGELDFFLLPGPTPHAVYQQFTRLTGRQQLPPLFSLGYHQCRWNYRDEKDVATVEGMFENLDYPVDVIWLDIEHTDGKRYFTVRSNVSGMRAVYMCFLLPFFSLMKSYLAGKKEVLGAIFDVIPKDLKFGEKKENKTFLQKVLDQIFR